MQRKNRKNGSQYRKKQIGEDLVLTNVTDQQRKVALSARKHMKRNCDACYANILCKHFSLGKSTPLYMNIKIVL